MHNRARIVLPVLLVVALIGGGFWWWNQRTTAATADGMLNGSGTIEVEDVLITAEVGGRVRQLLVDEGQEVVAGQPLARLDTALLEAQLAQARAAVSVAEANLELLRAGARDEEIAAARASVVQAQAGRDGAVRAFENAQAMLKNPQELNAQVAQLQASRDAARRALERLQAGARSEDTGAARAALDQAQANLQSTRDRLSAAKTQAEIQVTQAAEALVQAQARYAQTKSNWEYVRDTGKDPIQPVVTDQRTGRKVDNKASDGSQESYYAQFVQAEAAMHSAEQAVEQAKVAAETAHQAEISGIQQAEAAVQASEATLARLVNGPTREELAQAQTALAGAQRTLDVVSATRANPQQLKTLADNAQSQAQAAEAQLNQAQARLEQLLNGTRREQIRVAEAQLEQARAMQQQIEVQLGKATLAAPRNGIVLSRPIHEGEQANPGTALMTIGALDNARLTLYIPESQIGRVRLGMPVKVTVDGFPDRTFDGTVSFIAQQAEFTPRNVQTQQERITTVFAVRVDLPNSEHVLKPGMPADAVLGNG